MSDEVLLVAPSGICALVKLTDVQKNILGGIAVTGKYDSDTKQAIKEYQTMLQRNGVPKLKTTGNWDAPTQKAYCALTSTKKGMKAAQLWCELSRLADTYAIGNGAALGLTDLKSAYDKEIYRIRHALVNTWMRNYDDAKSISIHQAGGHYCWDWSLGFIDAMTSLGLMYFTLENRMKKATGGEWDHFFVVMHIYKGLNGVSMAIDDTFIDNQFVHAMPFLSSNYREPTPSETKIGQRPATDMVNVVVPYDDNAGKQTSSHEREKEGGVTYINYPKPNQGVQKLSSS